MTFDLLINLLEEHALWFDEDWYWCECGAHIGGRREHAEHVASLVALGYAT